MDVVNLPMRVERVSSPHQYDEHGLANLTYPDASNRHSQYFIIDLMVQFDIQWKDCGIKITHNI